ncbi:MAG: 8-oxo-dGTP diphosphatase MutT [Sandaracinaceae bacterium]|nr:8-oxo-dGTP diphosphatase MutT [Sandaracinaceae bacterium]
MSVVVAAAVIRREGRILLTRRMAGAHLAGLWEFPGGKLEEGESPEAALVRECREECAIEIEVIDIIDVAFHRYAKKDVLLLFYECRLVNGEVQNKQVAEHAWVLPTDLDNYDLPPPDARLVTKLKARQ